MRRQLLSPPPHVLALTVLVGLVYPLVVTGIGRALFNDKANGSIVRSTARWSGRRCIGQSFTQRPSTSSPGRRRPARRLRRRTTDVGASNLGPTNARRSLEDGRRSRAVEGVPERERLGADASGPGRRGDRVGLRARPGHLGRQRRGSRRSGSPTRGGSRRAGPQLIDDHTTGRDLGILGEKAVNVLALNLALDQLSRRRLVGSARWRAARSVSTSVPRPASARPSRCSTRVNGARPRHRRRGRVRRDARPAEHRSADRATSRSCRARRSYRGSNFEEMDVDAVLARKPERRAGRRARAHQRARVAEREALAGRRRAARRRHRRDLHGQRPAPRVAERRRRADHRRQAAGDDARRDRARAPTRSSSST